MGEPGREKAGAGAVVLMLVVLVMLTGAGYTAAYLGAADRLPRRTAIAGVVVGGLTPRAAEAALRRGLADREDTALVVLVDGRPTTVTPSEAGLGVDYAASVGAAGTGGRDWHPRQLWTYYTGGDRLDPVVTVDERAFDQWVAATDASVGNPPREGAVRFAGTRIATTQPRDGTALDLAGTRDALQAAYASSLAGERSDPLSLPTDVRSPQIDGADVERAITRFANPAMSSGVTLRFGHTRLRLSPEEYAGALSFEARAGRLVPTVDAGRADAMVRSSIGDAVAPQPATVRLVHGAPRVVPDKPGVSYRPRDVAAALLRVVAREPGHREIRVPATAARADFRARDARALGIREKVSSFTTHVPAAASRRTDIGRAASLVDGTVLEPGETFSLDQAVATLPRDSGAELGISQLATTTFNAMLRAGLQDVEHQPSGFHDGRYPAGRDASAQWGTADLKFTNDTAYGVLVSARLEPSALTVSMWSTKVWDVTLSTGERYAVTAPATRVLHTPGCRPRDGYSGFDADVTRSFHEPGRSSVDHSETFHAHYLPSDTVVCRSQRR